MEIQNKILALIDDLGYGKVEPSEEFSAIGFDSLDLVDLIIKIENEFKISIPDEETFGLKTVSDAIELVKNKTK